MKKFILFLNSYFLLLNLALAGTDAFLSIRTNDFTVLPTNIWGSNALAIAGALSQINFSPGTNTNSARFYPAQFTTNASGQVTLIAIDPGLLTGRIAVTNLLPSVASVASNLDPGLTNAQGLTVAQQIALATNAFSSGLSNSIYSTNLSAANAAVSNLSVSNLIVAGPISTPNNIYGGGTAILTGLVSASEFYGSGVGLTNIPGGQLTGTISGNGAGLTNIPVSALQGVGLTNSNVATVNFSSNLFVLGAVASGTGLLGNGANITGVQASNIVNGGTLPLNTLPAAVVTNSQAGLALGGVFNGSFNGNFQSTNQWTGDVAFTAFNNASLSPSGEQADIATGTNVAVLLGGPTAAWAADGFAGGRDGRWIIVEYDGGQTVTVRNESGLDANAGNRIRTGTGADATFSASPLVLLLRYNGSLARWVLMSGSGPATTGNFSGSFAGNGSGLTALSNVFNPTFQDTRPMSNTDLIEPAEGPSTNFVVFNQNGPGTVTQISISQGPFLTNWNYNAFRGPTLRIIVDGADRTKWIDETAAHTRATNNGVPVISFFAGDGWPIACPGLGGTNYQSFQGALRPGNIEITACDASSLTLSAVRNVYINFRTNCLIEITNSAAANNEYYSDATWRVGAPVTGTSWNATAMINSNVDGGIFTGFGATNLPGQLESIYWFYVESSGAGAYIGPPVVFTVDGQSWGLGKGTEDSFGSSWNWENGTDRYDTPRWGTVPLCSGCGGPLYWGHPEWYLGGAGATGSGNMSWRFFNLLQQPEAQVEFTNNFSWTFDTSGGSGDAYSIGLTTYYTVWPN
jgi:hypothetical protein